VIPKNILGRMSRAATLRQLQVFDALARLNSFTRVAEEMHLSQPTVSMQIKKLSEVVDLPLTEQVGKDIYLTDAGKELAALSRQVMQALEQFEERIDDLKGLEGGRVRLAIISTAQYFLPQVMQAFLTQHPNIDIMMEVVNKEHLLERLANNQDDIYI
jgi:DNA-binding transcriptional LysR family regulator